MLTLARDTERIVNSIGGTRIGTRAMRRWQSSRSRSKGSPRARVQSGALVEERDGTGRAEKEERRQGGIRRSETRAGLPGRRRWTARVSAHVILIVDTPPPPPSPSATKRTNTRTCVRAYHLLDVSRIRIVNARPGRPRRAPWCTSPDATRAIGTRGVSGSGNCIVKSFP